MERLTNDKFYVKLGAVLRQLRESKGMTQQEVATKMGVTRAAVANYENGLRAMYAKNLFGGDHPLSPTTIARVFNSAIKESGVKPIRLHDLRHSHATWLINNGVNIVAVSKRLGHTTIEQTLKTYTHLLNDTDDKMMDVISKGHESM